MPRDRREYLRKWREEHPDYHRHYYLDNPEKFGSGSLTPEQKERKNRKKSEREAKQRAALRAVRNHGVQI